MNNFIYYLFTRQEKARVLREKEQQEKERQAKLLYEQKMVNNSDK